MESYEVRSYTIIRSLLDCCELNMDDLEEETREVIEQAEDFLTALGE